MSALRDALGRLRAASEDDYEMLVAGDGELHRLITSVAGGRILRSLSSWKLDVLQPSLMNVVDEAVVRSAVIEQHKELVSAIDPATHREPSTMSNHVLYLADLLGSCNHSRPRR